MSGKAFSQFVPSGSALELVASVTRSPSREPARDALPWAALLTLGAIAFTAISTELLPSGLLPQIRSGYGVSESQVGFLTAGYAGVIVLTVLPLTRAAARLPRKPLLVGLVCMFALSNILVALSPTFPLAVAARLVGGAAHGLLWSLMAPFVARIVPPRQAGKAMAVVFGCNSLGLAVGAPLSTALGVAVGWRQAFLVLAGAGILLAAAAWKLLPQGAGRKAAATPSLRRVLSNRSVLAVAAAWPLMLLGRFTLFTFIAPFIAAVGLPGSTVSFTLSIVGIAGVAGIWIAGITSDTRPRISILTVTAVVLGAYLLLPVFGGTLACFVVLMALWGAGLGAAGIYNQSAILRAGGDQKDAANSLLVLTTQLGIAAGALYGGLALDIAGGLLVPPAAAIPGFIALAIILAGRRGAYPPGPQEVKSLSTPATPDPSTAQEERT